MKKVTEREALDRFERMVRENVGRGPVDGLLPVAAVLVPFTADGWRLGPGTKPAVLWFREIPTKDRVTLAKSIGLSYETGLAKRYEGGEAGAAATKEVPIEDAPRVSRSSASLLVDREGLENMTESQKVDLSCFFGEAVQKAIASPTFKIEAPPKEENAADQFRILFTMEMRVLSIASEDRRVEDEKGNSDGGA